MSCPALRGRQYRQEMCGKAERKKQDCNYTAEIARKTGCLLQRGKYSVRSGISVKKRTASRQKQHLGEMKRLCRTAEVDERKVFPHNLRHLFARTYYKKNHDIVYLADILGTAVLIQRESTRVSA